MTERIYQRIEAITGCNGKEVWALLTFLQSEQAPELTAEQVEDSVIYSLVRLYQDYTLSWYWFEDIKSERQVPLAA
jgi:hypothetical protein